MYVLLLCKSDKPSIIIIIIVAIKLLHCAAHGVGGEDVDTNELINIRINSIMCGTVGRMLEDMKPQLSTTRKYLLNDALDATNVGKNVLDVEMLKNAVLYWMQKIYNMTTV